MTRCGRYNESSGLRTPLAPGCRSSSWRRRGDRGAPGPFGCPDLAPADASRTNDETCDTSLASPSLTPVRHPSLRAEPPFPTGGDGAPSHSRHLAIAASPEIPIATTTPDPHSGTFAGARPATIRGRTKLQTLQQPQAGTVKEELVLCYER